MNRPTGFAKFSAKCNFVNMSTWKFCVFFFASVQITKFDMAVLPGLLICPNNAC